MEPAGDYYGDITITAQSEVPEKMNFGVTVLPFDLEPAPLTYGLYYIAVLPLTDPTTLTSGSKTSNQMAMELQDMKDHGVSYPTLYQPDTPKLDTALALRDTVGFPKDSIYLGPLTPSIGNATDPAGLATIADKVITWRNHTETYGYQNTYFYGMDEVTGSILTSQRPAWQTVHNNQGKMYVAGSANELIKMADILDTGVTAYALNKTQVPLWHEYGHKVLSYNNPQVGVENPEIYRMNFGFALWDAGYDGALDYAYQHGFGQSIWNDFDAPVNRRGDHYRDHVFAYPTTNGVIDTIQWEGWREGVDDTRYLATLIKKEGSDTTARALIADSLAKGEDMTTIRKKVINQILITSPGKPSKIGIYRNGMWYLDDNRNGVWDAGTDKAYNFGAPGWTSVVGDWNGDGKGPKIGAYKDGVWYLDWNGNGIWDAGTDKVYNFGAPGWISVTGDWNGDGKGPKIGAYKDGVWYLDWNGNGVWDAGTDKVYNFGGPGWTSVVGDWNGDGKGLKAGVYRDGVWYLDWNGNGVWDAGTDKAYNFGGSGWTSVVGDWNGDGKGLKAGVYRDGVWYLDWNGNGVWDAGTDKAYNFGGSGWTSVVGDWNGDGKGPKTGVYRDGRWYLDWNGNGVWDAGIDKAYNFGATGWSPVIEN